MMEPVRAPDFDAGFAWLNTDRPLRLSGELRGQVVVLDFWTYCCINCIHILPDLAFLEHKYANAAVTFIGVHSAKFPNEASSETIRAAILRYEIQHPVLIDENMKTWRAFAVRSWPTVVVIDSRGYVAAAAAGEGNRDVIDAAISQALAAGRANGTLAAGPLRIRREQSVRAATGLKFPGKVFADGDLNRLFVADSNHNRIVVAELPDEEGTARVVKVIGSGAVGRDDGPAERATFHHPQGLAVGQGRLYVADTENHLIRAVDLSTFEVGTIVGTGVMSNDRTGGLKGAQQGLNSPWDMTLEGSTMYVAMAGVHQIWRIDLPIGFARALAGSGRENIVDGPTETAALAQPSGICVLNGAIYFADSEVSAIRGIDMSSERVFTVIGEGLFSFGDVDGAYPVAKLQHPLGVAAYQGALLVADTYNHKIKRVDPGSRTAVTLYGTGRPGATADDGRPVFFEPGGLCVSGDRLLVADTNNHRVVVINLMTSQWHEVVFEGLTTPRVQMEVSAEAPARSAPAVMVAPGKDVIVSVRFDASDTMKLNAESPRYLRVTSGGRILAQRTEKSSDSRMTAVIPAGAVALNATWRVVASAGCCTKEGGVCIPAEFAWDVPLRYGGTEAAVRLTVDLGEVQDVAPNTQ